MNDDEINFTWLFLRGAESGGRQKSGSGLNQGWDRGQKEQFPHIKAGHHGRDLYNLLFLVCPILLPQCCRKAKGPPKPWSGVGHGGDDGAARGAGEPPPTLAHVGCISHIQAWDGHLPPLQEPWRCGTKGHGQRVWWVGLGISEAFFNLNESMTLQLALNFPNSLWGAHTSSTYQSMQDAHRLSRRQHSEHYPWPPHCWHLSA